MYSTLVPQQQNNTSFWPQDNQITLNFGLPDNQNALHFRFTNNQFKLNFGLPDNQIALHFLVTKKLISLDFHVSDNGCGDPVVCKSHCSSMKRCWQLYYMRVQINSRYWDLVNNLIISTTFLSLSYIDFCHTKTILYYIILKYFFIQVMA